MSLIRQRRRRKKNWLDTRKGMAGQKLVALLVLTLAVIWYLGWRF
ncbi:MAG: hypothetical protein OEN56_12475 [Gemmatimonadota bacterium]|nr:hypothetical protein [Gemmatimonadota bacterium]